MDRIFHLQRAVHGYRQSFPNTTIIIQDDRGKLLTGFISNNSKNPDILLYAGPEKEIYPIKYDNVKYLIELREKNRKIKNYTGSDNIKKELETYGITLEDIEEGTMWRLR